MKNFAMAGFLTVLIPYMVSAQMYVRGGIGYGLSLGSERIGTSTNRVAAVSEYEGVYGSFGKGFTFGAAFGATIHSNLKAELGFSYITGGSVEEKDVNPFGSFTKTFSGSMLSFSPGVVVSTSLSNLEPYARINAIISFPSLKIDEYGIDKFEFSGNITFGFGGGLGLLLPLHDRFMIYCELAFSNISWGPAEAKYTSMPSGDIETIKYEDNWNENQQNTVTSPRFPFGSVGINIGVLIDL